MSTTLAFDVYGTLINTHGVVVELEKLVGDRALSFSQAWRDKQLEYTFRRGLMQNYKDFAVCTRQALDYACSLFQFELSIAQKQHLLECYRQLPAFSEVADGLAQLQEQGFYLYAFSNGRAQAVDELLVHANIRQYFRGLVSVDEIQSFKPDPAVYHHFLQRVSADSQRAWLISSNPFDVLGSLSVGMKSVWVQRNPHHVFDPWDVEPTLIVSELTELCDSLLTFENGLS